MHLVGTPLLPSASRPAARPRRPRPPLHSQPPSPCPVPSPCPSNAPQTASPTSSSPTATTWGPRWTWTCWPTLRPATLASSWRWARCCGILWPRYRTDVNRGIVPLAELILGCSRRLQGARSWHAAAAAVRPLSHPFGVRRAVPFLLRPGVRAAGERQEGRAPGAAQEGWAAHVRGPSGGFFCGVRAPACAVNLYKRASNQQPLRCLACATCAPPCRLRESAMCPDDDKDNFEDISL